MVTRYFLLLCTVFASTANMEPISPPHPLGDLVKLLFWKISRAGLLWFSTVMVLVMYKLFTNETISSLEKHIGPAQSFASTGFALSAGRRLFDHIAGVSPWTATFCAENIVPSMLAVVSHILVALNPDITTSEFFSLIFVEIMAEFFLRQSLHH